MNNDRERIAQLERKVKELSATLDMSFQSGRHSPSPSMRLARAIANGSTYPSTGQTFWAEILNGDFPDIPGSVSVSYVRRVPQKVMVANTVCCVPPENEVVVIHYWGGKWWTTWCCTEASNIETHEFIRYREHHLILFDPPIVSGDLSNSATTGIWTTQLTANTKVFVSNCWLVPTRPVVQRKLVARDSAATFQSITQVKVSLCGTISGFTDAPFYDETILIPGQEVIVPVSWNPGLLSHEWELDITTYVNSLIGPVKAWHLIRIEAINVDETAADGIVRMEDQNGLLVDYN